MKPSTDHAVRVMTADDAIRIVAVRTTDTVRAIVDSQQVHETNAERLGEIVTSSVLVRETMAPGQRVQIILQDPSHNQLIGDAHPEGHTRGLARIADEILGVRIGAGCLVRVERVLRPGQHHNGVVETQEEEGTVASALQTYFQDSEQIVTLVDVRCVVDESGVLAAGGLVIQLLPEISDPPLARMRAQLAAIGDLGQFLVAHDADPRQLLTTAMGDEPTPADLADSPISFRCRCDRDRVVAAAAALGESELRQIIADNETLKASCDYCRKSFKIHPDDCRRLLDS